MGKKVKAGQMIDIGIQYALLVLVAAVVYDTYVHERSLAAQCTQQCRCLRT
jgi:hypothetical protein